MLVRRIYFTPVSANIKKTKPTRVQVIVTVLLVCGAWKLLPYEPIRHLVTVAEAQRQRPAYDYIIVGAGTVGCVLAERLSRSANASVLLIEAGRQFGLPATVPLLALTMQGTHLDWAYRSTGQQHSSFGLHARQQFLPRGKGLGGSAQLNYALHYAGTNAEDFERWQRVASGWGAATMQRYLRRLLCRDDTAAGSPRPVVHWESHDPDEGLSKVFDAMRAETRSTEPQLRFDAAASNTRRGRRWTTYHTHLLPALERPNLHILYGTRVHRVVFDAHRRAIGVRVTADDDVHRRRSAAGTVLLRAAREVVLCAGAFGTPHLLQLSGVGARADLERSGIAVVADVPAVGRNLYDHLTVPLFVAIDAPISLTPAKVLNAATAWRYVRHGGGWLARFGVVGFVADWRAGHAVGVFGAGAMDEAILRDVANTRADVFRAQYPMYANASQEGVVMLCMCMQPESRGTVRVRGRRRSAWAAPLIDPNYLADAADVACTRRAVRMAVRRLAGSEAMRAIGARVVWPRLAECRNFGPTAAAAAAGEEQPSDRYVECMMRTIGVTAHHPGGTCALGACVDERLR